MLNGQFRIPVSVVGYGFFLYQRNAERRQSLSPSSYVRLMDFPYRTGSVRSSLDGVPACRPVPGCLLLSAPAGCL